jgi:hypothetical protein
MRWLRPSLAVLVAALFIAAAVRADYNVLDKGTHYQGAQGQRVNSTGSALTEDVNYGAWQLFPNIIANQLSASGAGMQDSSQTQFTAPYKRLALALTGQFDSLSTVVRLAVQVRGHSTTAVDSGSTFPWYRWPTRATSNGTTDVDSLGHMYVGAYAHAQVTTANQPFVGGGPWPGEFLVKFNVARQDTADGSGGLGKFGAFPKTIYLPLTDASGAWFNAPYTSVRVRVLNGVRSRFNVRVDLIGMQ